MAKTSASINLLRNDKKETIEQIMNWTVTIGRILVIVVELVALVAFLYRFTLDNQLSDLHTKIKQEQAIVAFQKKNEDTYRNLQVRLSVASTYSKSAGNNVKILKDIVSFAPSGMTFTTLTLSSQSMEIGVNVDSVIPLSVFISKLKSYPSIDTVSLDKIENKTSNSIISVGLSATFKAQKGANAISNN
jgi:Tfp pilus assembly protein PilN